MTDPRKPLPAEDASSPDGRADAAFDAYFARRLAPVSFEAIDPAAIAATASPSPTRHRPARRAWMTLGIAAGLLLVLTITVTWLRDREPPITAVPAPAPSEAMSTAPPVAWDPAIGHWTLTASSPLGHRYDALSFYAEGRYYILGGYGGLTYDVLNNDWDLHGDPLFDGASYDPATNTWELLPSLEGVFPWVTSSSAATIVNGRLYVVSPLGPPRHVYSGSPPASGERAMAVLDLRTTGGWSSLPAPPASPVRTDQVLLATGDALFLFADGGDDSWNDPPKSVDDYVYDLSTNAWTVLPRSPQQSLRDRQLALLDGTHILLETTSSFTADGAETPGGFAIFDLATRSWRAVDLPYFDSLPTPLVEGIAAVQTWGPKEESPPEVATCRFAGIGGAKSDSCTSTPLTWEEARITGGLAARDNMGGGIVQRPLSTGTAVSVHDKLFDPRTNVLWRVPPLPGAQYGDGSTDGGITGVEMTAGGSRVLSCFGYTENHEKRTLVTHDACYLLPVPDPLPGEPLR